MLGKGTYGSVWKVREIATDTIYAIKEISIGLKEEVNDILREIEIMNIL